MGADKAADKAADFDDALIFFLSSNSSCLQVCGLELELRNLRQNKRELGRRVRIWKD
jgi:hypothetical protein